VKVAAAPGAIGAVPTKFPPRTPPDKDGKPAFVVAGDQGPRPYSTEKRRHFYRRGGVPVRVKILKTGEDRAFNAYRVTDCDGATGWQFTKPEGYEDVPYFFGDNPFDTEIDRVIFWPEGEKDVETVATLGGLAFTFGGTGDGWPEGCEQYVADRNVVILADNDEPGRKHAEKKALLASTVAASVKVTRARLCCCRARPRTSIRSGSPARWKSGSRTSPAMQWEIVVVGVSEDRCRQGRAGRCVISRRLRQLDHVQRLTNRQGMLSFALPPIP
jgi:hypothetical protein